MNKNKNSSQKKHGIRSKKRSGWKIFFIFLGASLFMLGISAAALVVLGSRDVLIDTDVAVVLGNEVYRNGQPSPRLAARLDKSLELYKAGHLKTIIVSGGVGLSMVDEAEAMAAYLESKGVPKESIVVDSTGVNTWGTAKFTAGWLKKHGRDGVIVISQHFHIPRSALALRAAGCRRVGQASPDYWETADVYSTLREIPANLVYWLKYSAAATRQDSSK